MGLVHVHAPACPLFLCVYVPVIPRRKASWPICRTRAGFANVAFTAEVRSMVASNQPSQSINTRKNRAICWSGSWNTHSGIVFLVERQFILQSYTNLEIGFPSLP